jgi:hypothetical protein
MDIGTELVPYLDRFHSRLIPRTWNKLRRAIIPPKVEKRPNSVKGFHHLSFRTTSKRPIFGYPNNAKGQRSQYTRPSG